MPHKLSTSPRRPNPSSRSFRCRPNFEQSISPDPPMTRMAGVLWQWNASATAQSNTSSSKGPQRQGPQRPTWTSSKPNAMDAFNRRDLEALTERFDPEIECPLGRSARLPAAAQPTPTSPPADGACRSFRAPSYRWKADQLENVPVVDGRGKTD